MDNNKILNDSSEADFSANLDNSNLKELISLEEAFNELNGRNYDLLNVINYEDSKILKSISDFKSKTIERPRQRSNLRSSSKSNMDNIGGAEKKPNTLTTTKKVLIGETFYSNSSSNDNILANSIHFNDSENSYI